MDKKCNGFNNGRDTTEGVGGQEPFRFNVNDMVKEGLEKNKYTKLRVWDFDGTLMDTLEPETGKPIWKEKTGEDWPHKGWWGRIESLDMSVFDFTPLESVLADYKQDLEDEDTLNVMLTGRRPKLGVGVKAVLDANDLKFDRYMYNYGSDTLSNKLEQMGNLLKEFPNIKSMSLHDDRDEHIPFFQQFGDDLVKSGRLDKFDLTHVHNPSWTK